MAGKTSFRRILLSRILLLSIPVLLMGEYVTYRKARSALLETARQNLVESAHRKATYLKQIATDFETDLSLAARARIWNSDNLTGVLPSFLAQLQGQLPGRVDCLQVFDLQANAAIANTCEGDRNFEAVPEALRPRARAGNSYSFVPAGEPTSDGRELAERFSPPERNEGSGTSVELVFGAPVELAGEGSVRYVLAARMSPVDLNAPDRPKSFEGDRILIDERGVFLEHPDARYIGKRFDEDTSAENAKRYRAIVDSALADRRDFLHLYLETPDDVWWKSLLNGLSLYDYPEEAIAGYAAIESPATENDERWVVLAIAPLDLALAGLADIWQVLFTLVLGLVAANLFATLYIGRELARPIERLSDYAASVKADSSVDPIPASFRIREFHQLASALNATIERLTAWAEELQAAWTEAKTANQLKTEFLTTISHELRTPLNAIIGCVRLVRDGCCDDRREELEFLQRADDASIHLLGIINDILDISKIEAGTLQVNLEAVDLQQVLQEAIDLERMGLEQKGLTLELPEFDEPIAVKADRDKLKQVLLNVISNAIKFTDEGTVAIEVRSESPENNGSRPTEAADGDWDGRAIVAVRDTGIGIAPQHQEKVFQPFAMANASTTRRYSGAGLGLAISRNLVELMGGEIELYSKGEGCGTLVEISLSRSASRQVQAVSASA